MRTPPQAVTSKIIPVGSRDFVITFSSSSREYPCFIPRITIATIVAIKRATKGSPKNVSKGIIADSGATTFVTVFAIIRTRGINIMPTTLQKLGSLDSSYSGISATLEGIETYILLPTNEPNKGPASIIAIVPQIRPTTIT